MHCSLKAFRYKYILKLDSALLIILRCLLLIKRTYQSDYQLSFLQKKTTKLKKASSLEDTDTDQESTSSASRAPVHHSKYA